MIYLLLALVWVTGMTYAVHRHRARYGPLGWVRRPGPLMQACQWCGQHRHHWRWYW